MNTKKSPRFSQKTIIFDKKRRFCLCIWRFQVKSDRLLAAGNAGNIGVTATGKLRIVNGGEISSDSFSLGHAGTINVSADSIAIDSQESSGITGIYSQVEGYGNAGNVEVASTGVISIVRGGKIASVNIYDGSAGKVNVSAGSIDIDRQGSSSTTGIFSLANSYSGHAGNVQITSTGALSIVRGGKIATSNVYSGDAGMVKISAASITVDGQGTSSSTGIYSEVEGDGNFGNAGNVEIVSTGTLFLGSGGKIVSSSLFGDAGAIKVSSGSIAIDRQQSSSITGIISLAAKDTGNIDISTTGNLSLVNGSVIYSTATTGTTGSIKVSAASIDIDNLESGNPNGIISRSAGNAGRIEIRATGNLSFVNGGVISSSASSTGNAGDIKVSAENIDIDNQGSSKLTGVFSDSNPGSSGNAGNIEVTTAGALSMANGGAISSSTLAAGDAGKINVSARSIAIDGHAASSLTGIRSLASIGSTGNAGNIAVTATGSLSIIDGGVIISDNFSSSGNAGTIKVNAGSIAIDSLGHSGATGIFSQTHAGIGKAGSIDVSAAENVSIFNGGLISSSTFALDVQVFKIAFPELAL